jgi:hypothetical protein
MAVAFDICSKCKTKVTCGVDIGTGECCECQGDMCHARTEQKRAAAAALKAAASKKMASATAQAAKSLGSSSKETRTWPEVPANYSWRLTQPNFRGKQEIQLRKTDVVLGVTINRKIASWEIAPEEVSRDTVMDIAKRIADDNGMDQLLGLIGLA